VRNITGMMPEHLLRGRLGERIACRFLLHRGYDVLARRYRGRRGELDIVAFEREMLVFVEVKTRTSREFGEPWEFVDWEQRQSLRRTAEEFIARCRLEAYAWRFDVVSVVAPGSRLEEVSLLRDAF